MILQEMSSYRLDTVNDFRGLFPIYQGFKPV